VRRAILAIALGAFAALALRTVVACTPTDRATLARTALDSADRGCRAYLELRRDGVGAPDAGSDGGP
jgi:hypothetical protein